ncbi:MAG: hypothetical protein DDT19_01199 [Syntrophomonadaceae bacterium]|nr:hypothetical protein [Bacillota bacterium]
MLKGKVFPALRVSTRLWQTFFSSLKKPLAGIVVSVSPSWALLSTGGKELYLQIPPLTMHPEALEVDARFLSRLVSGMEFCVIRESLTAAGISLNILDATRWDPALRIFAPFFDLWGALGQNLIEAIRTMIPFDLFRSVISGAAAEFIDNKTTGSLARCIGLGPGSTPAGDDFLTGLYFALYFCRYPDLHALRKLLLSAGTSTTKASARMLSYAAQGLFSEPLLGLASALAKGENVALATRTFQKVGHTSGPYLLEGVVSGANFLRKHFLG